MKPAVYFKKVNGEVKLFFRKDFLEGKIGLKPLYKSNSGHDFSYFKNWALSTLKKQYDTLKSEAMGLKEIEEVTKGFRFVESEMKKAFPVGTIRTWKGKKFIKSPDKKWRPYYDERTTGKENSKDNLGRRRAILAIAKKINALQDGDYKGLYDIIQANKDRFFSTNSDKSKMIELYEAMKTKGAVGSSRFSKPKKTEKKGEPKVEIKTEKEEEKKKEKPKEEEKTENKKEEEKKDKDVIPKDFKEMVIRSKATGKTGTVRPTDKDDIFEGTWLDGPAKGKTFVISDEGLDPEYYEIISVDGKTLKEEKPKEEEKEEKVEKGALTKEENEAMARLQSILPTSKHGWSKNWYYNDLVGNGNNIFFTIGTTGDYNSLKGIIRNNIDCDEKRLLAITALITDAITNGKCTESETKSPTDKWSHTSYIHKKFEKNGVIISTLQSEERCMASIKNIDTETNKEAFEKAIKDFEAKTDASEGFKFQQGTDYPIEGKWVDVLEYIKKAKRMVKTEVTKKEHEAENRQRKREIEALENKMFSEPTYENMINLLEARKVKHNPVGEKRDKPLEEDEIIKRLANYDGTKGGSCASQAYAYVAQKMGYDVFDYRGGASREVFSHAARLVLADMGNNTLTEEGDDGGEKLLSYVFKGEAGKQYVLSTGHHCAVVRKNYDGELQYLELQAGGKRGGWQNFDEECLTKQGKGIVVNYGFSMAVITTLYKRFNIKDNTFGTGLWLFGGKPKSKLFDIGAGIKEEKMNDFLNAMGYINTKEDKQKTKTEQEWIRDKMRLW